MKELYAKETINWRDCCFTLFIATIYNTILAGDEAKKGKWMTNLPKFACTQYIQFRSDQKNSDKHFFLTHHSQLLSYLLKCLAIYSNFEEPFDPLVWSLSLECGWLSGACFG